jgi:hypothetical protein
VEGGQIATRSASPKAPPRPVTFAAARRLALALPGVVEGTAYRTPAFRVAGRFFFRLREDGATLAVRIDFDTREALMQARPETFFITDHYKGYPAMLVRLATVRRPELKALLEQSWRQVAPKRLAASSILKERETSSGIMKRRRES